MTPPDLPLFLNDARQMVLLARALPLVAAVMLWTSRDYWLAGAGPLLLAAAVLAAQFAGAQRASRPLRRVEHLAAQARTPGEPAEQAAAELPLAATALPTATVLPVLVLSVPAMLTAVTAPVAQALLDLGLDPRDLAVLALLVTGISLGHASLRNGLPGRNG